MNKRQLYYILFGSFLLVVPLIIFVFYNGKNSPPDSGYCLIAIIGLCAVTVFLIYLLFRLVDTVRAMHDKVELGEQQLKSILDAVGDIAWHYDINTGTILCDRNFYSMLGYEPGAFEIPSAKLREWVHPEEVGPLKQTFRDYIDGVSDALQLDVRIKTKNDRWIWLSLRGKALEWDKTGTPLKLAGIGIDITEAKNAKSLLRESEERYRLVVESMDEYIFIICNDRIVFATPNISGLVKPPLTLEDIVQSLSPKEMLGRHDHSLYGKKSRIHLPGPDERWLETHSVQILWRNRPAQLFCWRDISEIIEVENRENRLESHLAQTQEMNALASLANSIARQYKDHMQVIAINAEMALLTAQPYDDHYIPLKKIESALEKLTYLIDIFYSFSKREDSSQETIDLNTMIRNLFQSLRCIIPQNITLRYHLKAKNKIKAAKPIEIRQAIINLTLNACDAMPKGGDIIIYTHDIAAKAENDYSSPYIALDIIDQGDGIPENIKPRIFDPFFTTKDNTKHLGLGLFTTHTIVSNCGGFIECRKVACGTRFKLLFPAIKPSHSLSNVVSLPIGGRETILMVDDNEDINTSTAEYLRRFGYHVIQAYCAEEALDIYESSTDTIDLVIMDLVMPGIGGIEGIKELHRIDPNVNIIVASAFVDDLFIEDDESRKLVKDIVKKPYLGGHLMLTTIRRVLNMKSL